MSRQRSPGRTICRVLGLVLVLLAALALPFARPVQGQCPPYPAPPDRLAPALPVVAAPSVAPEARQKGISFTGWWAGEYQDPLADLSLDRLATTGANWISLIVTAHQADHRATTIDFSHPSTPTDGDLIYAIQRAHRLGLKVMLKPHLDLVDELFSGYWRGDIGTAFTTEAQWATWFASYNTFIQHYAQLAQAQGVDQFCVGTELLGTSHREVEWRAVVAGVRSLYRGPLVYAALHGGEEARLAWWDAVDYIGVDAYYRLDPDDNPNHHPVVGELEAAWAGPIAILAALAARENKPIILTEIGYRSQHGCSYHPWDSEAASSLDLEEQANAYEAAFRQLYDQPWLKGMFWWQWHADLFVSGPQDDGFTPVFKPAEHILRRWYGGAPAPILPVLIPDYRQTLDIYTDDLAQGWQDWSWGAERQLNATNPVNTGTRAIHARLQPWGALSLQHPAFSSTAYRWLEFYVRGATGDVPLQVYCEAEDGRELCRVPVNDARHIEGGTIEAGRWKRVRIPLEYLNVPRVPLVRVNIQFKSGEGAGEVWIDDLRLLGAQVGEPFVAGVPLVVRR